MKLGLDHVSPLWFSGLRFATGAACLFAWQAARDEIRRPGRADLPVVASIGLLQMTLFNPHAIDWRDGTVVGAHAMLFAASAACILHLRYGRSGASAAQLAPWQMLLKATVLLPLAYAVEGPFTGDSTATFWACLIFVGPLATTFGFCAVNAASRRVPASLMSTLMLAVPVTGLVLATTALGETPSPDLILGAAAIVLGIAASAVPSRRASA